MLQNTDLKTESALQTERLVTKRTMMTPPFAQVVYT